MFSRTRSFLFTDPEDGWLRVESASLGNRAIGLYSVRSSGHEVSLVEEERLNCILPLRGKVTVATARADLTAVAGELLIFPPNERRTVVHRDQDHWYEAIVLAIPTSFADDLRDVIEKAERTLEQPAKLGNATRIEHASLLARDLHRILEVLRHERRSAASPIDLEAAGAHAEGLFRTLAASVASRSPEPRSGSLRQLKVAEDYIRAHCCQVLRMPDVARSSGLSLRGLQATFQRHRGMTPQAFLIRARLEEAHRRLLSAEFDHDVTEAALTAGFTHLGRFSGAYAARFGRRPSLTLAARRDADNA